MLYLNNRIQDYLHCDNKAWRLFEKLLSKKNHNDIRLDFRNKNMQQDYLLVGLRNL